LDVDGHGIIDDFLRKIVECVDAELSSDTIDNGKANIVEGMDAWTLDTIDNGKANIVAGEDVETSDTIDNNKAEIVECVVKWTSNTKDRGRHGR
jgi:hypothetical protein